GLSSKANNIPKLILENLIRWGYNGRVLGINPQSNDIHVDGIRIYKQVEDLPIVPDLAVVLIPAKFIPGMIEACGKFGIKRMAIPSGGFNELNNDGKNLAEVTLEKARKYDIRFVGPNCLTVANTANGMCLPFVPLFSPPRGGLSIISQSGGIGLLFLNFMTNENIGMAKFASIGNKLNLDEVDFLEYYGQDPETKIIGCYLESIDRGKEFIEVASKIDKPIIVLKAGSSERGKMQAMSHTAAISNDDDIVDAAFEKAGVIRINNFNELVSVTKAFELPPMMGKRLMAMSPAGGLTVMMADLCEKYGFEMADPGKEFYEGLKKFSNAGVINLSNPLDMGDIYDPVMHAHIFNAIMHNDNVDGAVYITHRPYMPRGEDVFFKMFYADLSREAIGSMRSAQKPLAPCLSGLHEMIAKIKQNQILPIFDTPEETIFALKKQSDFYARKKYTDHDYVLPDNVNLNAAKKWIQDKNGVIGEDALELLEFFGVKSANSLIATNKNDAVKFADKTGYPVVMKIVSPDAVHKTDVGGIVLGITNEDEAMSAFTRIKENLNKFNMKAKFDGVRVTKQADDGYDMFIGGKYDESFGPVVYFGYGGIYIEIFNDSCSLLCPSSHDEIKNKLIKLKSYKLLEGVRGKQAGDIDGYIDMIIRVSHLMSTFAEIKELDLNPVRILEDGSSVIALDARMNVVRDRISK
ncbi:MAG: hypothetical protein GY855_15465, partial [candidate division Zixibacteria bacterium]|nr:hypothetical protein [candidate division Zixibacteria bacterium]